MSAEGKGQRWLAVVNGAAGGGRCRARFDATHRRLLELGLELDVVLTETAGHASDIVAEAYCDGERRFLSVGGDGTSQEIVQGLYDATEAPEGVLLGMLPLGTGNSFLRDFGITSEDAAIDALLRGEPRAIDVVRVRHAEGVTHSINIVSVGFAADVGALTNRRFKGLGVAGYVAAVLSEVVTLAHHTDPIRLDGSEEAIEDPAAFLSFCNSRYTGGAMMMAPMADPSDGKLDVICLGAMSRGALVLNLPRMFDGTHVDHPMVRTFRAKTVDFVYPRRCAVMVDGEILTTALERLEVLSSAIEVLT